MRAVTIPGAGTVETKLILGEVLEQLDEAQLEAAYRKRMELIDRMVGQLYPRVLLDEADRLQTRMKALRGLGTT